MKKVQARIAEARRIYKQRIRAPVDVTQAPAVFECSSNTLATVAVSADNGYYAVRRFQDERAWEAEKPARRQTQLDSARRRVLG